MVHGENTAKMEFLTAIAKMCHAQNARPFQVKAGKVEFRGRSMGENQTEESRGYLKEIRTFTGG